MNTDTLDIVISFLKKLIVCEKNANTAILQVNKLFQKEFKDAIIKQLLQIWINEKSCSFFYNETISESLLRNVMLNNNIISFNLLTGNSSAQQQETHEVSLIIENESVIISISSSHFIDDAPDLLPEDNEEKLYVRTFSNIRTLKQFKQIFKHIWLENAYFIKCSAYNLQSILEGGGDIDRPDSRKFICFNE